MSVYSLCVVGSLDRYIRSAVESAVRTSSSSRQSPSTSATRAGLPFVPLFVRVPDAVSSVPRVQSSIVGVTA